MNINNSNKSSSTMKGFISTFKDYFTLMKPRVIILIIVTAIAGISLSSIDMPYYYDFFIILTVALVASSAAVVNMVYDQEIDAAMIRTSKRPLPIGNVTKSGAIIFAIILFSIAGIFAYIFMNWLSVLLLIVAFLTYSIFYTMYLKRNTEHSTVIGGIAGSLPPLITWVAINGNVLSWEIVVACLVIFFWTPPHFFALSIKNYSDYKSLNIPMLPIKRGLYWTKVQMVIYTLITVALSLALIFSDSLGWLYAVVSILSNTIFIYLLVKLCIIDTKEKKTLERFAFIFFKYSVLYMFLLFIALIIEGWY